MVPQLWHTVGDYSIAVYSSGGFDSTTTRHNFAKRIALSGRPTEVLHIGDHDPSGAHMFLALAEDIIAFAEHYGGHDIEITRLAVTPEQIAEHDLPTAPPKPSDKRAFSGRTCQAEALAPDVLAGILRMAVEDRLDRRAYRRVLLQERVVHLELMERLR
jgi:hypothetical protein